MIAEGTRVRIVASPHPFLATGRCGVIHWHHPTARLPLFVSDGWPNRGCAVQLVPGRDKVARVDLASRRRAW